MHKLESDKEVKRTMLDRMVRVGFGVLNYKNHGSNYEEGDFDVRREDD